MDNTGQKIGPLKKVVLTITAGSRPHTMDIISKPESVQFIFGTGTGGLTDLELMIADKQAGDEIELQIEKDRLQETFSHLLRYFPPLPGLDVLFIRLHVSVVSDASQREVVRALADAAACDSDCGCGCGGHE